METLAGIYQDGTQRILQYLKDNFGQDYFHAFFEGDPIRIPQSLLPCITVEKTKGIVQAGPTGTDDIEETILIKVLLNKKDDYGAAASDEQLANVDLTERKLRTMIEGRDATTGYFVPETLMGVLRSNYTLGNAILQNQIEIAYDVNLRPDEVITSEAHIQIVLRERVIIPVRV